jgi:hypothetical protein
MHRPNALCAVRQTVGHHQVRPSQKASFSDQQYSSLGHDGYHSWEILQFRYLLCVLFEYAAALGIIDVAYIEATGARNDFGDLWGTDDLEFLSRYDGLIYFRVTPLVSNDIKSSGPKDQFIRHSEPCWTTGSVAIRTVGRETST